MLKKFIKSIIIIVLTIILNDLFISHSTQVQTFTTASSIPVKKVGLLLGTSKYTVNGEVNLFYKYRLQAAKDLYDNDKVEFLILSGDNSTQNYNEPYTMQQDLLELGVPEEKLFLDHAGFRTLDSVVRASKVFDEDDFTIISQNFHNQRALFIANNKNIQAIAFNAKDVPKDVSLRVFLREKLARVKTVIDLFFKVEPKFLGEKILIK
ncbi:DUF218 domain-containing protein [bacterium]|jgi:SanA protein|nr:DUF218 domain-containing protein [bacterium]MBT6293709.1 DUF218 domain-containing protein [bacterium]